MFKFGFCTSTKSLLDQWRSKETVCLIHQILIICGQNTMVKNHTNHKIRFETTNDDFLEVKNQSQQSFI